MLKRCATHEPLKSNADCTSDAAPPGSASLECDDGDALSTAPPKGNDEVDDDDGVMNGEDPHVTMLLEPYMTRPKVGKIGEDGDTTGSARLAVGKAPRAHTRTGRARPRERARVHRREPSHIGRDRPHHGRESTPQARPSAREHATRFFEHTAGPWTRYSGGYTKVFVFNAWKFWFSFLISQ